MALNLSQLRSEALLGAIPAALRSELLIAYTEIVTNYREHRWEPSELNGGKMCEVVYSIIRGLADGQFPVAAVKPGNMVDACRAMEQADANRCPRSVRVQIPRVIMALYEVRNNRGVGHVGGDVAPNAMDAAVVLGMAKWLMAELVRLFHQVGTDEAAAAVEDLVERTLPVVWQIEGERRVLDPEMSMLDSTLFLLYEAGTGVGERELVRWVEHSNPAVFRRDILVKAHRRRLLEYNRASGIVTISPVGIRAVEVRLRASSAQ